MKDEVETTPDTSGIPGYTYGTADAAQSPVSIPQLEQLKQSVGFTPDDARYLKMAGEVLRDQTKTLVDTWRGLIAKTGYIQKQRVYWG